MEGSGEGVDPLGDLAAASAHELGTEETPVCGVPGDAEVDLVRPG